MFQESSQFRAADQKRQGADFEPWSPLQDNSLAGVSPADLRKQELDQRDEELKNLQQELQAKEQELKNQEQEAVQLAGRFQAMIGELEKAKRIFWMENNAEIASFGFALAEKIVLEKLDADAAGMVSRQIKAVIEDMKISEGMEVQLNPDDLVVLQKSAHEGVATLLKDERIKWTGNSDLAKGGIYIDTSRYRLDASVMTALKNLKEDVQLGNPSQTS